MATRREARKSALDLLYASELRGEPALAALECLEVEGEAPAEYTAFLVRGVVEHQHRIDELLTSYSKGWSLTRMPAVDRNVLRIGVFELIYVEDVPDGVAVAEAMSLVRQLSTDESPVFVNGVLGALQRDRAQTGTDDTPAG